MSAVIKVESLSKRYIIGHQKQVGYQTFREMLSHRAKSVFRAPLGWMGVVPRAQGGTTEEFWALRDVTFDVKEGDRVGIIGRNGAGKSTLLKVLSRITEPTKGRISIKGRVASLLEVGTGFHPELTGRENIYLNGAILGMNHAEILRKFDQIVSFAEIERFLDTPVKRYSSGMYVRLAFAVAAYLESEILIVDEVLAVGDAEFQKKCLGKMGDVSKNEGRTVLFVSHNMSAIQNLCQKAILLKNGGIQYQGIVSDVTALYHNEDLTSNQIEFDNNKYVKMISINQIGDKIELICDFETDVILSKPIIGFVISDKYGNRICGDNPLLQKEHKPILPHKKGTISALIEYPKLLNGKYLLSFWFADGIIGALLELENVLTFEITDMVKYDKPVNPDFIGPVVPVVSWSYHH